MSAFLNDYLGDANRSPFSLSELVLTDEAFEAEICTY